MEHMKTLPDTEDPEEILQMGYLIRSDTLCSRKSQINPFKARVLLWDTDKRKQRRPRSDAVFCGV